MSLWLRTVAPLSLAALGATLGYAEADNRTQPTATGTQQPATLADLGELRRDMKADLGELRRDSYLHTALGALGGAGIAGAAATVQEARKRRRETEARP